MRALLLTGVAVACVAAGLHGQAPGSGATLTNAIVITAPAAKVFAAFTTAEGVKQAWGVAAAKVDFRLGGEYRTAYDTKTDLDGPDAIVNTILAFEPDRMLAIRPSAPRNAAAYIKKLCETAWTVIRLEPLAPDRTRVSIAMVGIGEGPEAEQARKHFDLGNAFTLQKMKNALGDPNAAERVRRARERIESLCGEWTTDLGSQDGAPRRAFKCWSKRLNGNFVVADGWIGEGQAQQEHGHLVIGVDPQSGGMGFWKYGAQGELERGHVRAVGDDRVALEWTSEDPSGKRSGGHMQLILEGKDAYRMVVHPTEAAAAANEKPLVEVLFRRK